MNDPADGEDRTGRPPGPTGGAQNGAQRGYLDNLRANSQGALHQFEALLPLDGMPAVLVVRKALKAGDPVEIVCISNFLIELGLSYTQPYGKLSGQRKPA